ncbi:MAG: Ig-like domain-containing protein [Gammaproteobacteria bacterium]|nr:Ig-like domain-containing protein [Gammaproteobacteria bacterium]
MKKQISITLALIAALLQSACGDIGDNPAFSDGNTAGGITAATGIPAIENFRLTFEDGWAMTLIDPDNTQTFTHGTNTLVAHAFDRNGIPVSNATINFALEWGQFPDGISSCITDSTGTCTVQWGTSAIENRPLDNCVRIVAYTFGEESFRDSNGNGIFDDADTTAAFANTEGFVNGFIDLPEPFFDVDDDGVFISANDKIITGFGLHDAGDGNYNGSATCSTTNFCSTTQTTIIWDGSHIDFKDETTATVPAATNTCI